MKRFTFRFQRLLQLKQLIEDERQAQLGDAIAQLNRHHSDLHALEATRLTHRQMERPISGESPSTMILRANYLLRLQREIVEQGSRIKAAQCVVDERRRILLEATRERKVYETLRQRASTAYRHRRRRYEQTQLDEIGGQLHLRGARDERARISMRSA